MVQWFERPEIEPLWYDAVFGELAAHQRYGRKHKTKLPERRDTLWYGDGTKLNLYYRDEDGKIRTTMVYEVIDAYSEVHFRLLHQRPREFRSSIQRLPYGNTGERA